MNRDELISAIAEKSGSTKTDAAAILKAFIETIQTTVADGQSVNLIGFGTWEAKKKAARTGRNPMTGEAIEIAAKTVPTFKAGKTFKTIVDEG